MYGATVGKLALLSREMTCNQACCALIVDDAVANYRFIYYTLLSARPKLANLAVGAAQQNLSAATIKSLRFAFPPLDEQRAIASVLGALDDKIELNRNMSATLEAIARALFKSWFVDFDPVRAKAEGRDTGLPPEIAALFPDSFENSELGPIPTGWTIHSIASIAVVSRTIVNPMAYADEAFHHYSIPAFDEGRLPVVERGISIRSNKFLLEQDDILVSRLNPRTPRVWRPNVNGTLRSICSTEFAVMRSRALPTEWLYCLLSSSGFSEALSTMVTGTSGSHQRVKPESLLAMRVITPPTHVAAQFAGLAAPFLSRVPHCLTESQTLAALRDVLLPKLISGEIRVGEAERMIGKPD